MTSATGIGLPRRTPASAPADAEAERLAEVDRYATVAAECGLADLVRLAADVCGAPGAAMALVDADSVRTLAAWGTARDGVTVRHGSVADVVAITGAAAVIPDAAAVIPDAGAGAPFAAGTGTAPARFCAAVPLRAGGHTVGALYVVDTAARDTGEAMLRALTALAARIDTEVALRHAVAEAAGRPPARYGNGHVAQLSHEIRTPLASIQGYLELLLGTPGAVPDEHAPFVDAIGRNAARLCRTVDHLLHAAAGRPTISHRVRADLGELAAGWVRQHAHHGRDIVLRTPPEPVLADVDAALLGRAVHNLLANAILFSAPGTPVTVTVDADPHPEIQVTDDGIGIPHDEAPHVRAPFFRGAHADRQQLPGLGLGLTVADEAVTAHGGRLSLTSRPGHGTSARITLPGPAVAAP
jgi:signal transduction histidine kinase